MKKGKNNRAATNNCAGNLATYLRKTEGYETLNIFLDQEIFGRIFKLPEAGQKKKTEKN